MRRPTTLAAPLLALLLHPACGDPARPALSTDGGGGRGGTAGTPPEATLENVQAIYDARCAGSTCHIGNQYPQMGLDLSPGTAFRTSVGVAAAEDPTRMRVEPGHPERSYLLCKVDPACPEIQQDRMPIGPELRADQIDLLRRWIAAGAPGGTGPDAGVPDGPPPADVTPPRFAGLQRVTFAAPGTLVLAWDAATDDRTAAGQIAYRIYSSGRMGSQRFAMPTRTVTGVTEARFADVSPGQPVYFVVRAADEAGNEESNAIERSGEVPDRTAPTFAGATEAAPSGPGMVTVRWLPAMDDVDDVMQVRYRVYVASQPGMEPFAMPATTTPPGASEALIGGLDGSRRYYFVARAVDTAGNEDTNTVEQGATTLDSVAPMFGGATGATAGPGSITLSWAAASDDTTAAGSLVYLVYQADRAGAEIYTTPTYTTAAGATTFAVGGLARTRTYFFVVRARDQAGNIDTNTREVSAMTPVTTDRMAPTFGGATAAAATGPGVVTLTWSAASDDLTAPAAMTYLVYQASTAGGESFATPSHTTVAGATTFAVGGLSPGQPYFFVVRARDQAGNTDANVREVSATTTGDTSAPTFAGASSATASGASIVVSWAAASDDVTPAAQIVYLGYQATAAGGESFSSPSFTSAPGATSQTVSGLAGGATYYLVVRARDQAGNTDANRTEVSAATTAAAGPPTFAGLASATATSGSSIALSWAAATDDSTPASQIVYLVYQASAAGAESYAAPTYTTSPGATSFAVTGLSGGSTYFFVVRARDAMGNIERNTVERSATTPGAAVSFSGQVWPIFAVSCASSMCHDANMPAQGLNLGTSTSAYAALVNHGSSECGSNKLVLPGMPDASYLVWKLAGTGPCFTGSQMPKIGQSLPADQITLIRNWISNGAPNN